ncbi:MAG: phage tail sheath family protein, partial [Defluviitaleaceae bacterium]|nr:phage tail sheath family protein [Defluviitaleaceae bacterium]
SIFTLDGGDFQKNTQRLLGFSYDAPEMRYLRELFKGARTAKLYRPATGTKATGSLGVVTATAKYGGSRGNAIKILIEQELDDEDFYQVTTMIGETNTVMDRQFVADAGELKANDFVTFAGTGEPDETGTLALAGGTDAAITGNDHSDFIDKAESEMWTTICYAGTDLVTKGLYDAYVKRLRDDEGYKVTLVLYNYTRADFEGTISVKNEALGLLNADADSQAWDDPGALVYWVAGQTAGAEINQSLTNRIYDGELLIDTQFKKTDFELAISNGELAFYGEVRNPYRTATSQQDANAKGEIKVLLDINTFTSFTPYKNKDFANNQIIRILDQIATDTARIFDAYYLGKVQNEPAGRDLFKGELIHHRELLQGKQAITNFNADDIVVSKGEEKGDVVVTEAVEPVGAMDKLYMTTTVI